MTGDIARANTLFRRLDVSHSPVSFQTLPTPALTPGANFFAWS